MESMMKIVNSVVAKAAVSVMDVIVWMDKNIEDNNDPEWDQVVIDAKFWKIAINEVRA